MDLTPYDEEYPFSTKWPPSVEHAGVFKTKLLHFKIENTLLRLTNGKRKFKRRLIFLFVDKRKLFVAKLFFQVSCL